MDPALLALLMQHGNGADAAGASATPGTPDRAAALQAVAQLLGKLVSDDDDDDARERRRQARQLALARRREEAARRVALVRRTVAQLSRRNAFVAGALGACECWGMDVGCAKCGGSGEPGAFEPVGDAFDALVLPLLERRSAMVREALGRTRDDGEMEGQVTVH